MWSNLPKSQKGNKLHLNAYISMFKISRPRHLSGKTDTKWVMQPVLCYHGYKVILHSCAVCASCTNQLRVQLLGQVENNCPIVGAVVCRLSGVVAIKAKWHWPDNKQHKQEMQTLSTATSSPCWRHVNLRVPNDVQRNIQAKLKQPRKESDLFTVSQLSTTNG